MTESTDSELKALRSQSRNPSLSVICSNSPWASNASIGEGNWRSLVSKGNAIVKSLYF